jgi:hypothetical protein
MLIVINEPIMLNVFMLSVTLLSVIMLSANMLSVIMLRVEVPSQHIIFFAAHE